MNESTTAAKGYLKPIKHGKANYCKQTKKSNIVTYSETEKAGADELTR
jgi:hypothetical protein